MTYVLLQSPPADKMAAIPATISAGLILPMLPTQPLTDPRSPATTPGVPRLPLLRALTSVRFFAAAHVALYHLVRPFSRWGLFAAAIGAGYTGVSFFFFLSGFILTYAHAAEYERGRGNPRKFFFARFARVYPVYLVSTLFAGFVYADQFHSHVHILAFVADLLLLQSWSMRMINFFNASAWTLSCEAFFYLVFPFVLLAIRPRTRRSALAWIALFYLLAMAAPLLLWRLYPDASWTETFDRVRGLDTVFLINRLPIFALPEFLAGMSLAWLFLRFRPSPKAAALCAVTGSGMLALALCFADHLPYVALHNGLLIPLYALLLLGLAENNLLSRLLSGPILVLLGESSYALYLIHILINSFAFRFGYDQSLPEAAVNLLLATCLAILMHLYIERPCRRVLLEWWARRHPSQMQTV